MLVENLETNQYKSRSETEKICGESIFVPKKIVANLSVVNLHECSSVYHRLPRGSPQFFPVEATAQIHLDGFDAGVGTGLG